MARFLSIPLSPSGGGGGGGKEERTDDISDYSRSSPCYMFVILPSILLIRLPGDFFFFFFLRL